MFLKWLRQGEMSAYENVVIGKLRLKGKALDARGVGIKKRKKYKERNVPSCHGAGHDQLTDGNNELSDSRNLNGNWREIQDGGEYERLTPAERRYMEQLQKIEAERLAKAAKKSHRDRIHQFNQYLANLSEHNDIPKVGPG